VPAKTLMIQGTASSVGKSILVAALCRIFHQDGFRVAPFKSQNMALNSFVTPEGGEIGRAQAVQAEAAGILPSIDMNPVLLKPEADSRSQVIVSGKAMGVIPASQYYSYTPKLIPIIEAAMGRLRSLYDVVVIEGAGSPAEVNLKAREIVNMHVAKMAHAPVLLVGDIDRGGVFASLVGTLELLDVEERDFVKGFIINKFRGDVSLLKPGLDMLEDRTGKPVLGVVHFLRDLKIAQEDSVYLDERPEPMDPADLDIVIIHLPYTSNYDDFDPLEREGCRVRYVSSPDNLGRPDMVIIPGSKTTVNDLRFLREGGLARAIVGLARNGAAIAGICGGFQMLGKVITDPNHVESSQTTVEGLGLLDVATSFETVKTTNQIKAKVLAGEGLFAGLEGTEVTGYEIHMGQSTSADSKPAMKVFETHGGKCDYLDGASNPNGSIFGTYVHGLFHNVAFTDGMLSNLRKKKGLQPGAAPASTRDEYDVLADAVRKSLDMEAVYRIVGLAPKR
jgi:adenosylcobyric acid synthase